MERRTDSGAAWEHRIDRGALLPPVRRDDGTLLVEGFAAREGVLVYRHADGRPRRELVPLETLKASISGLGLAAVTLHHPDPQHHPSGVTPDNHAALAVGTTDSDVELREGGFIRVRIAVKRRDAIDAVAAGTQELSPGYDVRIDHTPGVHPIHGPYDCIQTERRYNHLAIVDMARGGHEVRMRADALYSTETYTGASTPTAGRPPGSTVTHPTPAGGPLKLSPLVAQLVAAFGLGSQRFDTDDQALEGIHREHQRRSDAASTELSQAKTQLAAMTAERDAAKARADAADADLTRLKAAEQARTDAATKADLEGLAKALHLDASKCADLKSLRRTIAATQTTELKADASDERIDTLIDVARTKVASRGDGRKAGSEAWTPPQGGQGSGDGARFDAGEVPDYYSMYANRRDSQGARVGGEG